MTFTELLLKAVSGNLELYQYHRIRKWIMKSFCAITLNPLFMLYLSTQVLELVLVYHYLSLSSIFCTILFNPEIMLNDYQG